jgi:hypothetical protein
VILYLRSAFILYYYYYYAAVVQHYAMQ